MICKALLVIHAEAGRLQWGLDTLGNALLLARIAARDKYVTEQVLDLLPASTSDPTFTTTCQVVSHATFIPTEQLSALLCRFKNNNHQLETEALYPAAIAVL